MSKDPREGRPTIMGALWQSIEKKHMEWMTWESIDDEEWIAFCERFGDAFADEVSDLARTYWIERSDYEE